MKTLEDFGIFLPTQSSPSELKEEDTNKLGLEDFGISLPLGSPEENKTTLPPNSSNKLSLEDFGIILPPSEIPVSSEKLLPGDSSLLTGLKSSLHDVVSFPEKAINFFQGGVNYALGTDFDVESSIETKEADQQLALDRQALSERLDPDQQTSGEFFQNVYNVGKGIVSSPLKALDFFKNKSSIEIYEDELESEKFYDSLSKTTNFLANSLLNDATSSLGSVAIGAMGVAAAGAAAPLLGFSAPAASMSAAALSKAKKIQKYVAMSSLGATSLVQQASNSFSDYLNKGVDESKAFEKGLAKGVITAGTELSFGKFADFLGVKIAPETFEAALKTIVTRNSTKSLVTPAMKRWASSTITESVGETADLILGNTLVDGEKVTFDEVFKTFLSSVFIEGGSNLTGTSSSRLLNPKDPLTNALKQNSHLQEFVDRLANVDSSNPSSESSKVYTKEQLRKDGVSEFGVAISDYLINSPSGEDLDQDTVEFIKKMDAEMLRTLTNKPEEQTPKDLKEVAVPIEDKAREERAARLSQRVKPSQEEREARLSELDQPIHEIISKTPEPITEDVPTLEGQAEEILNNENFDAQTVKNTNDTVYKEDQSAESDYRTLLSAVPPVAPSVVDDEGTISPYPLELPNYFYISTNGLFEPMSKDPDNPDTFQALKRTKYQPDTNEDLGRSYKENVTESGKISVLVELFNNSVGFENSFMNRSILSTMANINTKFGGLGTTPDVQSGFTIGVDSNMDASEIAARRSSKEDPSASGSGTGFTSNLQSYGKDFQSTEDFAVEEANNLLNNQVTGLTPSNDMDETLESSFGQKLSEETPITRKLRAFIAYIEKSDKDSYILKFIKDPFSEDNSKNLQNFKQDFSEYIESYDGLVKKAYLEQLGVNFSITPTNFDINKEYELASRNPIQYRDNHKYTYDRQGYEDVTSNYKPKQASIDNLDSSKDTLTPKLIKSKKEVSESVDSATNFFDGVVFNSADTSAIDNAKGTSRQRLDKPSDFNNYKDILVKVSDEQISAEYDKAVESGLDLNFSKIDLLALNDLKSAIVDAAFESGKLNTDELDKLRTLVHKAQMTVHNAVVKGQLYGFEVKSVPHAVNAMIFEGERKGVESVVNFKSDKSVHDVFDTFKSSDLESAPITNSDRFSDVAGETIDTSTPLDTPDHPDDVDTNLDPTIVRASKLSKPIEDMNLLMDDLELVDLIKTKLDLTPEETNRYRELEASEEFQALFKDLMDRTKAYKESKWLKLSPDLIAEKKQAVLDTKDLIDSNDLGLYLDVQTFLKSSDKDGAKILKSAKAKKIKVVFLNSGDMKSFLDSGGLLLQEALTDTKDFNWVKENVLGMKPGEKFTGNHKILFNEASELYLTSAYALDQEAKSVWGKIKDYVLNLLGKAPKDVMARQIFMRWDRANTSGYEASQASTLDQTFFSRLYTDPMGVFRTLNVDSSDALRSLAEKSLKGFSDLSAFDIAKLQEVIPENLFKNILGVSAKSELFNRLGINLNFSNVAIPLPFTSNQKIAKKFDDSVASAVALKPAMGTISSTLESLGVKLDNLVESSKTRVNPSDFTSKNISTLPLTTKLGILINNTFVSKVKEKNGKEILIGTYRPGIKDLFPEVSEAIVLRAEKLKQDKDLKLNPNLKVREFTPLELDEIQKLEDLSASISQARKVYNNTIHNLGLYASKSGYHLNILSNTDIFSESNVLRAFGISPDSLPTDFISKLMAITDKVVEKSDRNKLYHVFANPLAMREFSNIKDFEKFMTSARIDDEGFSAVPSSVYNALDSKAKARLYKVNYVGRASNHKPVNKTFYVKFDKGTQDALVSITSDDSLMELMVGAAASFQSVLRYTITRGIDFIINNPIRDIGNAFSVTRGGRLNLLKSLGKEIVDSPRQLFRRVNHKLDLDSNSPENIRASFGTVFTNFIGDGTQQLDETNSDLHAHILGVSKRALTGPEGKVPRVFLEAFDKSFGLLGDVLSSAMMVSEGVTRNAMYSATTEDLRQARKKEVDTIVASKEYKDLSAKRDKTSEEIKKKIELYSKAEPENKTSISEELRKLKLELSSYNKELKEMLKSDLTDYQIDSFAVSEAVNLLNYRTSGTLGKKISAISIFYNVFVQGLDRTIGTLANAPGQRVTKESAKKNAHKLILPILFMAVAQRSLSAFNIFLAGVAVGDDEEKRKRAREDARLIQKEFTHSRQTTLNFNYGSITNTQPKYLSIGLGFISPAISTLLNNSFDSFLGDDEAFDNTYNVLSNTFNPYSTSNMLFPVVPLAQSVINKNLHFDSTISKKRKTGKVNYNKTTPFFRALDEHLGLDAETAEQLIEDIGAYNAKMLLNLFRQNRRNSSTLEGLVVDATGLIARETPHQSQSILKVFDIVKNSPIKLSNSHLNRAKRIRSESLSWYGAYVNLKYSKRMEQRRLNIIRDARQLLKDIKNS